MKVRYQRKDRTYIEGQSSRFNTHGLSEVIAGFDDDTYDSFFIKDLDVFIPARGWMTMRKAFEEKWIVPNNLNTLFAEPLNEESRERGWND